VISGSGIQGNLAFTWVNETNRDRPLRPQYSVGQYPFPFKTDWQELLIPEFVGAWGTGSAGRVWVGELVDLRLDMSFTGTTAGTMPEAVEFDWIQLTGVEEQLQGELPPPEASDGGAEEPGELFGAAVFSGLLQGTPRDNLHGPGISAALGDLDADRDADLICAYYKDGQDIKPGWLEATNDGTGKFTMHIDHPLAATAGVFLQGSDLDADGLMDVIVRGNTGDRLQHLRNVWPGGWEVSNEISGWGRGLADGDGDGVPDLWIGSDPTAGQTSLWVMQGDSAGGWHEPQVIPPPPSSVEWFLASPVQRVGPSAVGGFLWSSRDAPAAGGQVVWLAQGGVAQYAPVELPLERNRHHLGDVDGDGDVDALVSGTVVYDDTQRWRGLSLLTNRGDGTLEETLLDPDVLLADDVTVADLNADNVLDAVFADGQLRHPAVVVFLGDGFGHLREEGRYPLSGRGGAVLTGDVNGDAAIDLVVFERAAEGQGGVHVLLSRLSEGTTAVAEERTTTLPVAPALSPAYPNPFNASTLIPVSLPVDARQVSLVIYDLLGQPVRRLIDGPLSAGAHLIRWDGTDDRGAALSSGVYVYRLRAGDASAVGRVVVAR
jgi:hypothetical protein